MLTTKILTAMIGEMSREDGISGEGRHLRNGLW